MIYGRCTKMLSIRQLIKFCKIATNFLSENILLTIIQASLNNKTFLMYNIKWGIYSYIHRSVPVWGHHIDTYPWKLQHDGKKQHSGTTREKYPRIQLSRPEAKGSNGHCLEEKPENLLRKADSRLLVCQEQCS